MTDEFAFSEYTDFRLAYHQALEEIARLRAALERAEQAADDDNPQDDPRAWTRGTPYRPD